MATSTLRPLSIGEILDAGIKVVQRQWRPLIKSILLFVFPLAVVSTLLVAAIDPDQLELNPENTPPLGQEDAADLGGMAVTLVLGVLTFLMVTIACFKIVCDAWLGATPDVGRSLRFGLRRVWPAFLLTLVWTVCVFGAALLIIPGIWLCVVWSLSLPALLFEGAGPIQALRRSFALVKGRWWATFLLVLVGLVLVTLFGTVVSLLPQAFAEIFAPENALANGIASVIGTTIAGVILYPYSSALLTIMYFDQRVRKEGFDLQLLAQGVGVEHDPDAPLPAPYVGGPSAPPYVDGPPAPPPPPTWSPPPEQPWSSPGGWSAPEPDAPCAAADRGRGRLAEEEGRPGRLAPARGAARARRVVSARPRRGRRAPADRRGGS